MKWIFKIFQNFVHWALKWLRKHILKKTESLYKQELYLLTIENEHITYLDLKLTVSSCYVEIKTWEN